MTQQTSRIRLAEISLITIATVVILLSGYKIYDSKYGDGSPSAQTRTSDSSQSDISLTAHWLETRSRGGTFSMKVPDGWQLTNYAPGKEVTGQITGQNLTYTSGQRATVTDEDSPLQPTVRPYGLGTQFNTFVLNKKYEYKAVASETAKSTSKAVTRGGLSGTLTTTQYSTSSAPDVPQNQTEYVYTFPLPSDKTLVASYVHQGGQPDEAAPFEQAVRTIQIIK